MRLFGENKEEKEFGRYVERHLDLIERSLARLSEAVLAIQNMLLVELTQPTITSFIIKQQGGTTMLPLSPGNSPVFTATPVPAGTLPATGNPPTWTTSDPLNAPIVIDPTGLVATVAIPATAVVGTSVTLSISYTNADGTAATGSAAFTIVAAPPSDITSFTVAQTA
jgi:hypothetical protein